MILGTIKVISQLGLKHIMEKTQINRYSNTMNPDYCYTLEGCDSAANELRKIQKIHRRNNV